MADILSSVGAWAGFVVWSLVLITASLLVYLGLGGNFIIVGLALIHALVTGFDPIGWTTLGVLLGLAVLGEGLEFVIGTFYPARKGATKDGVIFDTKQPTNQLVLVILSLPLQLQN